MHFRGGIAKIHDFPGLARVGEFDPGYLYLDEKTAGAQKDRREAPGHGLANARGGTKRMGG